jgi:plasmid maintenance system antidote protein VapI
MNRIDAYKGIPPGKIITSCLNDRNISQRQLSEMIGEHYQTLNAVIKGKRMMTIALSLKLDKALHFEPGFFAIIQTYHLLRQETAGSKTNRTLPKIRRIVFWDIDMDTLDWNRNKDFIVKRVNERGNAEEIKAVNEYYG